VACEVVDEPGGGEPLRAPLVLEEGIGVAVQGFAEVEQALGAFAYGLTLDGLDETILLLCTELHREPHEDMGGCVGGVEKLEVWILQVLAVPECRAVPHLVKHPRAETATELASTISLQEELFGLVVGPEPQGLSSQQPLALLAWNSLECSVIACFVETVQLLQRRAVRLKKLEVRLSRNKVQMFLQRLDGYELQIELKGGPGTNMEL